jgi:hypothetical protein
MERFAAIVRIGDSNEHRTEGQALSVLRLHVKEGCWSSPPVRELPAGTPVIASHVRGGLGWFLLGVFAGDEMDIPWPRSPEHANHIGHAVSFMDAASSPTLTASAELRAATCDGSPETSSMTRSRCCASTLSIRRSCVRREPGRSRPISRPR